MKLDSSTINELVKLLRPYMEDERNRRPFLVLALGNDAPVLQRITWSGAVATFIPDMVCKLADYGEVAPGRQALWALLEYVRSQAGVDVQQRIDKLRPLIDSPHFSVPNAIQVSLRSRLILSLSVAFILFLIRSLGGLEFTELRIFDWLMRNRVLVEEPDSRLTIIEVNDKDLTTYAQEAGQGWAIKDKPLINLLTILQRYEPQVIGLDIYLYQYHRNFSNPQQVAQVRQIFNEVDNLIAICKLPSVDEYGKIIDDEQWFAPPDEEDIPSNRVGFSNFADDGTQVGEDGHIRRQLLVAKPPTSNSKCLSEESFSLLLAYQYLTKQGYEYVKPKRLHHELKLGNVPFPQIGTYAGGYQGLYDNDYEIFLNYRATNGGPEQIAEIISLSEFLTHPERYKTVIQDRIVLIGLTAHETNLHDNSQTPFGELPGIIIHAHMTSQLLSAVLDNRRLIWVLPQQIEIFLIVIWSILGGCLGWMRWLVNQRSWIAQVIILLAHGLIWFVVCLMLFSLQALWLPLCPPLLGFFLSWLLTRRRVYCSFRLKSLLSKP